MSSYKLYDQGILQAVIHYIRYGLQPGSCATMMIIDNIEAAKRCAHEHIKQDNILEQTFSIINHELPDICLGTDNYLTWIEHGGLENVNDSDKIMFVDSIKELLVTNKLRDHKSILPMGLILEEI